MLLDSTPVYNAQVRACRAQVLQPSALPATPIVTSLLLTLVSATTEPSRIPQDFVKFAATHASLAQGRVSVLPVELESIDIKLGVLAPALLVIMIMGS